MKFNNNKLLQLGIFFCIALIACKNSNQKKEVPIKVLKENTELKEKRKTVQKTNFELLKGKWVHEDDKTNFLVFEKNIRKEIAGGMNSWDEEEFILSNSCLNESNLSDKSTKEKDCYISCKNSDLCWYIMSISEDRLTLQYQSRGNLLIYNRVNK